MVSSRPMRVRGPVVLRGKQVKMDTADEAFLESRSQDPWRIMRMQAEIVEGFSTLAPIKDAIAVFGSARTKRDSHFYRVAEETGRLIADKGFSTITGAAPASWKQRTRVPAKLGDCRSGWG